MSARNILRQGHCWLTMERDCFKRVENAIYVTYMPTRLASLLLHWILSKPHFALNLSLHFSKSLKIRKAKQKYFKKIK